MEDREIRLVVIALMRSVTHLRVAVEAMAPADPTIAASLQASAAALEDAVDRIERAAVHERA